MAVRKRNLKAILASGSVISIAETLGLSLLQFLIYAVLIRITEPEVVGLWVLINSLLVFSRAADVWSHGLSSFVAQARGQGRLDRAASFSATAAVCGAIGFAVLGIIAYAAIWLTAGWIAGDAEADLVRSILPLMVLTFWMMSMTMVLCLTFLGFERPELKAAMTVGGAALFLILVLLLAPYQGLWGLLLAQALQAGATLVIALVLVLKLVVLRHGGTFQFALFLEVMTYSLKALGVGVFQRAIDPVIRLIVNAFGGLAAVAVVELASRLVQTMRGLVVAVGQVMIPAFARIRSSGTDANMADLLKRSERQFAVLGTAGFTVLLAAGPILSTVILGERSTILLTMLWLLAAGWFGTVVAAPAYFMFQGVRDLRPLYMTHGVMTLGALVLGTLVGLALDLVGAMVGIALALGLSAWQLWHQSAPIRGGYRLTGGTTALAISFATAAALTALVLSIPATSQSLRLSAEIAAPIVAAIVTLLVLPVRDVVSGLAFNQSGSAP